METGYRYGLQSDPLSCGCTVSTQTVEPDFHLHNTFEIYFLLSGNVVFLIENKRWQLKAGDLVLLNNRQVHKSINPSGEVYRRFVIHFDPQLLYGFGTGREEEKSLLLSRFLEQADRSPIIHLESTAFDSIRARFEAMQQALLDGSIQGRIKAHAYLVLLLCELEPVQNTQPLEIRQDGFSGDVMDYLQAHLSEPFSLDALSETFMVNKHHLCRRFKAETGGTVYRYLLLKRIAVAQSCLLQGESVQTACETAGFGDYANFIRCFKKHVGLSPGQYQKRFGH